MSQLLASRRVVFHGLSALGVASVLAGCGGDDATSTSEATGSPSGSPSPTEPSTAPSEQRSETASPTKKDRAEQKPALASTDEVPVGGGIVLMDERIVLVQPSAGEFVAWSAICKHEGQTVGQVQDNVITCLFHGSQYASATGEVVGGPAPSGLDPVQIKVSDGRITVVGG